MQHNLATITLECTTSGAIEKPNPPRSSVDHATAHGAREPKLHNCYSEPSNGHRETSEAAIQNLAGKFNEYLQSS